jgi:hypothetical protein
MNSSGSSERTTALIAAGASVGTTAALLVASALYPLSIVVGAEPLSAALAVGLFVALGTVAARTPVKQRHPSFELDARYLRRILAWWLCLGLACMLLAVASWRTWGTIAFLAAIVIALKVVSVFGYIKSRYEFRVWLPFAAIIGVVMAFGVAFLFVARPTMPPPIPVVVSAYGEDAGPTGDGSRTSPDLTSAGLTLEAAADTEPGGLPATWSRYRDEGGNVVDLYQGQVAFPPPAGATREQHGWSMEMDDAMLRAVNTDGHYLIVWNPDDERDAVATALGA